MKTSEYLAAINQVGKGELNPLIVQHLQDGIGVESGFEAIKNKDLTAKNLSSFRKRIHEMLDQFRSQGFLTEGQVGGVVSRLDDFTRTEESPRTNPLPD
jgi:hypothetical protein